MHIKITFTWERCPPRSPWFISAEILMVLY
jgi:hypothetical protein